MAASIEYTAENVEKAVNNFYCNSDLQREAHVWLTSAQVSQDAWAFCWQLLAPDKGVQVQFFGASCLHVKISKYWNELPQDQYASLRSKTLEQVINFGGGAKLVLTRLCIALSSLALQSMPEVWSDPIGELVTIFQDESSPLNSEQRCSVLLEILTVLPEEFFSANLTNQRRSILRHELRQSLTKILSLLSTLMTPSSPDSVYEQALKCFSSWVDFGVQLDEAEPVILQVFRSLDNPTLFDMAVDTLTKVFSHPDSQRFPFTIHRLLPMVLQLQGMLNKAITEHDVDTCYGLTQLVVSLAENHTKLILDGADADDENKKTDVLNLVQLVLLCSCVPGNYPTDEMCSNMTFTFWYILQDNLIDLEPDKYQQLLPVFQPIYLSLIENLLIKVQYPPDDVYGSWSAEEKEQFRCYRQDIGDTMMYAYSILREPLLGHLCNALISIVNNTTKEADVRWQLMEAIFFLFSSVAERVDLDENLYLPSLLELLPKIHFSNIRFITTALSMLGSFGEWMSYHPDSFQVSQFILPPGSFGEWMSYHPDSLRGAIPLLLYMTYWSFGEWMSYHPDSLRGAIPLLLQGLGNPAVAQPATMALKDVTRETLDHIQPYIRQILNASQEALQTGNLKYRENIRLMSCVGQVLSVLPVNEIMDNLKPILTPHLRELEQLAEQQPSVSVKNGLLLKLNMLSWLFASLDTERDMGSSEDKEAKPKPKQQGPKPVFMILQQIAPILQTVVSKWITDTSVIEVICELFKRALQTLMGDFLPLSKDVAELLVQMYQTVPHVAVLDLTKQLIIMFGTDAEFSGVVKVLLQSICRRTLDVFQGDIQQNTDIVEAFMNLLSQILKKSKNVLLEEDCGMAGLFQAGIIGISLPENHTVKASSMFLVELISLSEKPQYVNEVIVSQGQLLLDRIMRAVGGESARLVIEHLGDVMFTLSKHYLQETRTWAQEMIEKEGYPSPRCSQADKEQFIRSVLRERVSKRRVRELVKEFTLLCRGLLGTEYASQMATLM